MAVGRINEVASLTEFSYEKMYGRFASIVLRQRKGAKITSLTDGYISAVVIVLSTRVQIARWVYRLPIDYHDPLCASRHAKLAEDTYTLFFLIEEQIL